MSVLIKFEAGVECHQAGGASALAARMAAMFLDPNNDFSMAQCHTMASIGDKFGGQQVTSMADGSNVAASGTGVASGAQGRS